MADLESASGRMRLGSYDTDSPSPYRGGPRDRKKKGMALSTICTSVTIILLSIAVFSLVIAVTKKEQREARDAVNAPSTTPPAHQYKCPTGPPCISLEDVMSGRLRPQVNRLVWSKSGKALTDNTIGYVINSTGWEAWSFPPGDDPIGTRVATFNMQTDVPQSLLDLPGLQFAVDPISPDGTCVLLRSDVTPLYRHSRLATYHVVHVQSKKSYTLASDIRAVSWRPAVSSASGKGECAIAYSQSQGSHSTAALKVALVDFSSATSAPSAVTKVVAADAGYLSGVNSWAYEEEVEGSEVGMWWAPDGKSLVYTVHRETSGAGGNSDSDVPEYQLQYFEKNGRILNTPPKYIHDGLDSLYPQSLQIPYPKVGFPNPLVSLKGVSVSVDPSSNDSVVIGGAVMINAASTDIIQAICYLTNTQLRYMVYTRDQTARTVYVADVTTGAQVSQAKGQSQYTGWMEPVPSQSQCPISTSDGGVKELYDGGAQLIKNAGPDKLTFPYRSVLTPRSGNGVVFLNAPDLDELQPGAATTNAIYSYTLSTGTYTKISPPDTRWDEILSVSANGLFAVTNADGFTNVIRTSDTPNWKTWSTVWGLSKQPSADYQLPRKEFITVPSADPNYELNALVRYPPGFDKSKRYPVLFKVYGGPTSQTATEGLSVGFDDYVTSELGVIVVSVDNRGTGARGPEFSRLVYRQLGQIESADQIAAAKYFAALPYVMEDRIAIWGWSYGGFMTLRTLLDPESRGVFRTGVAVAPVTDWHFYDTIYTERYMGLNGTQYNQTSLLWRASNLQVPLLLMHGTGDDNVHFQNTAALLKRFIETDIEIDFMAYPDENHSIYRGNSRRYLYRKMMNFLRRELVS